MALSSIGLSQDINNSYLETGGIMNRDQFEGNWEQFKGRVQRKWGKLTDSDLQEAKGNARILAGKVQERYGRSKEEASQEVNSFIDHLN